MPPRLSLPTLKDIQANDPFTAEALEKIRTFVNALVPAAAGKAQVVFPATETVAGTWSNPGYCLFGNPNIGRAHTTVAEASPSLVLSGFASSPGASGRRSDLRVQIPSSCTVNASSDTLTLDYSLDAGVNWTVIYTLKTAFGLRVDLLPLVPTQDLSKFQIRLRTTTVGAHTVTLFGPVMKETVAA